MLGTCSCRCHWPGSACWRLQPPGCLLEVHPIIWYLNRKQISPHAFDITSQNTIFLLIRYLPPCYHKRPLQHRSCCWEQLQSRQHSVSRGGCHCVSPGEALGLGHWSSGHNCPLGSGREINQHLRRHNKKSNLFFNMYTSTSHSTLRMNPFFFFF